MPELKELKFSDLKVGDIFTVSLCGYTQLPMIKIRSGNIVNFGVVNAISISNGDRHNISEDEMVRQVFKKVIFE